MQRKGECIGGEGEEGGCRVDGDEPSQVNEPEPQPEKYHMEEEEAEVENADDDEQSQVEVKVEPQPLNDYSGGPHEVYIYSPSTNFMWPIACLKEQ